MITPQELKSVTRADLADLMPHKLRSIMRLHPRRIMRCMAYAERLRRQGKIK